MFSMICSRPQSNSDSGTEELAGDCEQAETLPY